MERTLEVKIYFQSPAYIVTGGCSSACFNSDEREHLNAGGIYHSPKAAAAADWRPAAYLVAIVVWYSRCIGTLVWRFYYVGPLSPFERFKSQLQAAQNIKYTIILSWCFVLSLRIPFVP